MRVEPVALKKLWLIHKPVAAMVMANTLTYIGYIETPYERVEACPNNIDPSGPECRLIVNLQYVEGLSGLEVADQILILYWLEQADRERVVEMSRKTGKATGVFALRTPNRPNPIGVAVIRINEIRGNEVIVRGLDCVNGTILLDIKPVIMAEKSN